MEVVARNEVVLVGRIPALAQDKQMPSGDLLTTWRLVVDRPPSRRKLPEGVRPVLIDTLDCSAWATGVQRLAQTWQPGDVVQVEGALRRRFYAGPGGASSRYEIEVSKARRLTRAA